MQDMTLSIVSETAGWIVDHWQGVLSIVALIVAILAYLAAVGAHEVATSQWLKQAR